MKSKIFLTVMAVALLMAPSYSCAAPVLDVAATIMGFDVEIYPFRANEAPFIYEATLVDLSDIIPGLPPGTKTGFKMLLLTVTDAAGDVLGSADFSGSFKFRVDEGKRYFAWVNGDTGENDIGAFGVTIEAVPIPAALVLLGSGLIGLLALKRRKG
jgi:hypothetical protein